MKVVWSIGERPHFVHDCWCRPKICDHCGAEQHRHVELTHDVQPRMAVFSDQRAVVGS